MNGSVATFEQIRRLIVGATVVIVASACAGGPGPVSTAAPAATAAMTMPAAAASSATEPGSPSVTASPDQAVVSWTPEAGLSGFEARDLAARDDTIVAIGCLVPTGASGCSGAAIEAFIDGAWVAATLEGDTHLVDLQGIAAGERGFVVVGRRWGSEAGVDVDAIAFTSTDGRTWRRAPDQVSFHGKGLIDVVARPGGGWLAVGAEAGPTIFLGIDTWTSTDGLVWTMVDSMPQVGIARGVTSFEDGFITWGTDCLDVCGPPERAALWRTKDGEAWVRVPSQPSLAHAEAADIIGTPQGALAVGTTFDGDANATGAAWLTVDGARWTRVALPDAAGHQSFRIASTGGGYATVGARSGDAGNVWGTWLTTDGATWHRLPGADVRAGSFDLAAADGEAVGAAVAEPPAPSETAILRLGLP